MGGSVVGEIQNFGRIKGKIGGKRKEKRPQLTFQGRTEKGYMAKKEMRCKRRGALLGKEGEGRWQI